MITLTDGAIKAVERFISNSDKPTGGLRLEAEASPNDSVMDYGDIKVFVDADSLPALDGMTVDFLDSFEGSGFKFTNPNAVKSCACGTSFSTDNNGGDAKTCTPH